MIKSVSSTRWKNTFSVTMIPLSRSCPGLIDGQDECQHRFSCSSSQSILMQSPHITFHRQTSLACRRGSRCDCINGKHCSSFFKIAKTAVQSPGIMTPVWWHSDCGITFWPKSIQYKGGIDHGRKHESERYPVGGSWHPFVGLALGRETWTGIWRSFLAAGRVAETVVRHSGDPVLIIRSV